MNMVEEEDTELDELYDIVDLGDEIIRFFRNYSSVLVDDIIKKKLRKSTTRSSAFNARFMFKT